MEINPDSVSDLEELKAIRRNLRRRNYAIVLTSLLLAAALLVGTVRFAIPAAEKLYWYPEEAHFSSADSNAPQFEEHTDLEMTLQTYSELFCPGQRYLSINSLHTGFATYLLSMTRLDDAPQETFTETLTLKKGQLQVPQGFWKVPAWYDLYPNFASMSEDWVYYQMDVLKERMEVLPPYLLLSAYVTFREDISVLELLEFRDKFTEGNAITAPQNTVLWMAVRHEDPSGESGTLCGMSAGGSAILAPEMNKTYPCFDDHAAYKETNQLSVVESIRAKILEERFVSLLRYSDDQLQKGRGIGVSGEEDYYQNAIAYVEENGVKVYGCYIVATPQRICEMMDWENIGCIVADQIWIDY